MFFQSFLVVRAKSDGERRVNHITIDSSRLSCEYGRFRRDVREPHSEISDGMHANARDSLTE